MLIFAFSTLPAMIPHTAKKIAELKGIVVDEVLRAARESTRAVYGIWVTKFNVIKSPFESPIPLAASSVLLCLILYVKLNRVE